MIKIVIQYSTFYPKGKPKCQCPECGKWTDWFTCAPYMCDHCDSKFPAIKQMLNTPWGKFVYHREDPVHGNDLYDNNHTGGQRTIRNAVQNANRRMVPRFG